MGAPDDPRFRRPGTAGSSDSIPIRFPKGIRPREKVAKAKVRTPAGLEDKGLADRLQKRMEDRPGPPPREEEPVREGLMDTRGLAPHIEERVLVTRHPPRRIERKEMEVLGYDDGTEADYAERLNNLSMMDIIKMKLKLKRKRVIVSLVVLAIILTPLFVIELEVPEPPRRKITLDGDFSDWGKIYQYDDTLNEQTTSGVEGLDISRAAVTEEKSDIFVYVELEKGTIFTGTVDDSPAEGRKNLADAVLVFVDINPTLNYGYSVYGIEADYMIEVQGFNGKIISAEVKKFNDRFRTFESKMVRDSKDWHSWQFHGWATARNADNMVELGFNIGQIDPAAKLDFEFVIQVRDNAGNHDYFDKVLSLERPSLTVRRLDNTVDIFTENDLLTGRNRIHLFSLEFTSTSGSSVIEKMLMSKLGTMDDQNVNSIQFYEDSNSDGRYSSSDTLIQNSLYGFVSGLNDLRFPEGGLTVVENEMKRYHVVAELRTGVVDLEGLNLGIELSRNSFTSDAVVTYYIDPLVGNKMHYLISMPDEITIDGIFSDWSTSTSVTIIADSDPAFIIDKNVNILNYGYLVSDSEMAVFLSMQGNILNGEAVPLHIRYFFTSAIDNEVLPDVDGDGRFDLNNNGIEENYNTRDDDYDNDDIPDSIDPDIDNDFVINELDLEPRDPSVGEQYPDLPQRLGYDIYRIYADLDGNPSTGYDLAGTAESTGSELLLEFRGRDSRIYYSGVFLYEPANRDAEPSGWVRASVLGDSLEVANDLKNLEAAIDLRSVANIINSGSVNDIDLHFLVLKWNGAVTDYSNNIEPVTRSGYHVTTLVPVTGNCDSSYSLQSMELDTRKNITRTYMILTTVFIGIITVFLWKLRFF